MTCAKEIHVGHVLTMLAARDLDALGTALRGIMEEIRPRVLATAVPNR